MSLISTAGSRSACSQYALRLTFVLVAVGLFSSCSGGSHSSATVTLSPAAAVGEKLFNDINLSASGAQACATCHNPNNAHAQTNDLAVQLGGQDLKQLGVRTPPSLNYLDQTPAPGIDVSGNPFGGFDRDGRAASLADQAQGPLLSSFEMGNASAADVVSKVQQASYASAFSAVFGAAIFNDTAAAFNDVGYALQQYQIESPEFHPYNSKYDQYLNGTVSLTAAEMQGLAIFNDPARGNCNSCHSSAVTANGTPPLFTDFRYATLGVPRNPVIPVNDDGNYFDLGVCGPYRLDLVNVTTLCGAFKVPTLRNVATRKVFFHNGIFNDLTVAVTFLAQRDTSPAAWYPVGSNAQIRKFNDLPPDDQINVDVSAVPFNQQQGGTPTLSANDITNLVAFLNTLSDGYVVTP